MPIIKNLDDDVCGYFDIKKCSKKKLIGLAVVIFTFSFIVPIILLLLFSRLNDASFGKYIHKTSDDVYESFDANAIKLSECAEILCKNAESISVNGKSRIGLSEIIAVDASNKLIHEVFTESEIRIMADVLSDVRPSDFHIDILWYEYYIDENRHHAIRFDFYVQNDHRLTVPDHIMFFYIPNIYIYESKEEGMKRLYRNEYRTYPSFNKTEYENWYYLEIKR